MRSNRLFSLAIVACAAAVGAVADRCRGAVSFAAAYLIDGLRLFSEPKLEPQKALHPRTGLTARERHDLGHPPAERCVTPPQWRMCPSG